MPLEAPLSHKLIIIFMKAVSLSGITFFIELPERFTFGRLFSVQSQIFVLSFTELKCLYSNMIIPLYFLRLPVTKMTLSANSVI